MINMSAGWRRACDAMRGNNDGTFRCRRRLKPSANGPRFNHRVRNPLPHRMCRSRCTSSGQHPACSWMRHCRCHAVALATQDGLASLLAGSGIGRLRCRGRYGCSSNRKDANACGNDADGPARRAGSGHAVLHVRVEGSRRRTAPTCVHSFLVRDQGAIADFSAARSLAGAGPVGGRPRGSTADT